MLKMKAQCQQCNHALGWEDSAYICSIECTFCPGCARVLAHQCPNCAGALMARPQRTRTPAAVAAAMLRHRLRRILPRGDRGAPTTGPRHD